MNRSPFSVSRRPRRRNGSVALARALRVHSEFSFFCLHRAPFCLQLIDIEWIMGEVFTLRTRVKYLCNYLVHSVLWVKVRGALFGAQPSPSAPPWNGVLCAAVFVVPPTAHWVR